MKVTHTAGARALAFLAVVLSTITAALAQGYPARPIRLIVATSAGGSADLIARRIGPKMSQHWGQQVVVDNRAGAGGVLGADLVAKAVPDGYTLLVDSIAFAVKAAVYPKLPFDAIRDFAPVSQLVASPSVLVVAPALGVKSASALIALAKQKPGQITFASAGIGSGTHLNGEQFRFAAGIDVVHVPYKGGPEALLDTMTGRVQYFISPLVPALPFIRDGRLLPLAVTTAQRTPMLPDVPTVAEAAIAGYEFQSWFGMFAPAGTPRPIVYQLSAEMARIVDLPDVVKQMTSQGEQGRSSTPEEFGRFFRAEVEKYRKLAKLANIRVD